MTIWAQTLVAAFKPLALEYRVGNAIVSYAAYIGQMFYATGMVVEYVHPGPKLRLEDTLFPAAVLAAITLAVAWLAWRRRYLAVGWLWYLGMLVPVIGLVQVGAQARADRYTYLTQIGLYIMIAWGLGDLAKARAVRGLACRPAVPIIALLAAVAWLQTSYWKNSLTLWGHSVDCQPTNDFAQNEYGQALADAGRTDEAMEHYAKAFELNPLYLMARTNYAVNLLQKHNNPAEALQVCDEALQVDPNDAGAHFIKAVALILNRPEESIREFYVTIEKDPKHVLAHNNLAEVLQKRRKYDEAMVQCHIAPDQPRSAGGPPHAGRNSPGEERPRRGGGAVRNRPEIQARRLSLARGPGRSPLAARQVPRGRGTPQAGGGLAAAEHGESADGGARTDQRSAARGPLRAEALEIARPFCETSEHKDDIFALDLLAGAYAETGDFDRRRPPSAGSWRRRWERSRTTSLNCRSD